MSYTQVELVSGNDDVFVYWLHNDSQQVKLRPGLGIRILEEEPYLRIKQIFVTLKNIEDLPVKHRIGTIVEIN